jgi:hypothetical protein
LQPLLDLIRHIGTYSARRSQRRIIVDVRDSHGRLSVTEQYEHGVQTARSVPAGSRLAVVARADQALSDRFWETVTRNRGLATRIASDPKEALDWLFEDVVRGDRASHHEPPALMDHVA